MMLAGWWLGCVADTGGERVTFSAEVAPVLAPDADGRLRWTDEAGWAVTLHEAVVWAGPLYLWSDEPFLQVGRRSWLDVLLPTAHANPDHFEAGYITGEVTEQARVDLVAGEVVDLGLGAAIAGPSKSGELYLEPSPEGAPLRLAGVAERDGVTAAFSLSLAFDDAWFDVESGLDPVRLRRVRGIPWSAQLTEGGLVTISVDVRRVLFGVDFAELVGDGEVPILPGTGPGRVVLQRSREVGAGRTWGLSWTR